MAPRRSPAAQSSPRTPSLSTSSGNITPSTNPSASSVSRRHLSSVATSTKSPSSTSASPPKSTSDPLAILNNLWSGYRAHTPHRVLLIDTFLAFLVIVGVLQFVYCVLAGNYPFNAFLAGFSATVGQFVLTASLRIQTNPENKTEFVTVSNERAFADYVFGSLLLHFICVNFIN